MPQPHDPVQARPFRRVLKVYERHYNESRPHQGIGNGIPRRRWDKISAHQTGTARASQPNTSRILSRNEAMPGLLASYHWEPAPEKRIA